MSNFKSGYFRSVLEGPGLAAVLQERLSQIERYAHNPLEERNAPPLRLATLAAEFAQIARDRCAPGERQTLEKARKKAVQAAALHLALIDVLDHQIAQRNINNATSSMETER